jgi:hypothetical protein
MEPLSRARDSKEIPHAPLSASTAASPSSWLSGRAMVVQEEPQVSYQLFWV